MLRKTALKRGRGKGPNAVEKRHHDRVAQMGCLVCGGEATLHHVTGYADRMGRLPRSHMLVVPLCPVHHQKGHDPLNRLPQSVEALGHRGFYDEHGIDLWGVADMLWGDSLEREDRAV